MEYGSFKKIAVIPRFLGEKMVVLPELWCLATLADELTSLGSSGMYASIRKPAKIEYRSFSFHQHKAV